MSLSKTAFRLAKTENGGHGCCGCGCNGQQPCQPLNILGINGIAYKNERTTLILIGEHFNFALHENGLLVNGLESYTILNGNMIAFTFIPTTDKVTISLRGACGNPASFEFDVLALPEIPDYPEPPIGNGLKVPYMQLNGHKKGWKGKTPWTVLFKEIKTNALTHFFVVNGQDEHGVTGNYGIKVRHTAQYRIVNIDNFDSTSPFPQMYVQVIVNGVSVFNQPTNARADNHVNILLDLKKDDIVNIRYVGYTTSRSGYLISHPRASANETAPSDGAVGGLFRLEYCGN